MISSISVYYLSSVVLVLVLAVPSNACIVVVYLESIRKKEKLSPSDVIFLAKGTVNILIQCLLSLQGMFLVFCPLVLHIREVHGFMSISVYLLMNFSFWLTAWLSIYYCMNITNLSFGFFVWLKGMISNFLRQILFLTALGVFIVAFFSIRPLEVEYDSNNRSPENGTELFMIRVPYYVRFSYLVPVTLLGCIFPFFLSLLCFVLTFSFLFRHVWRVKNDDSGSTRPNLQAHVTALRTIFFLLFISIFFLISRIIFFSKTQIKITDPVRLVGWTFRLWCPLAEAAVIFQCSSRLKRIILRRFWTRIWRKTET